MTAINTTSTNHRQSLAAPDLGRRLLNVYRRSNQRNALVVFSTGAYLIARANLGRSDALWLRS